MTEPRQMTAEQAGIWNAPFPMPTPAPSLDPAQAFNIICHAAEAWPESRTLRKAWHAEKPGPQRDLLLSALTFAYQLENYRDPAGAGAGAGRDGAA